MSNNGEQHTLWGLVQRDYGYSSPDEIQDGDTLEGLECEGIGTDWGAGANSYAYFSRLDGELYCSMSTSVYSSPQHTYGTDGERIPEEQLVDFWAHSSNAPDGLEDMLLAALDNRTKGGRRHDIEWFGEWMTEDMIVFQGGCDVKLSDTLDTLDRYALAWVHAVTDITEYPNGTSGPFWQAVARAGENSATGKHDWNTAPMTGTVTCRNCDEQRDEYSANTCPAWQ